MTLDDTLEWLSAGNPGRNMARKLLIEQVRRELLDQLRGYQVGLCHDGEITATKNSDNWDGYLLVIPDDKWVEWFGGINE